MRIGSAESFSPIDASQKDVKLQRSQNEGDKELADKVLDSVEDSSPAKLNALKPDSTFEVEA